MGIWQVILAGVGLVGIPTLFTPIERYLTQPRLGVCLRNYLCGGIGDERICVFSVTNRPWLDWWLFRGRPAREVDITVLVSGTSHDGMRGCMAYTPPLYLANDNTGMYGEHLEWPPSQPIFKDGLSVNATLLAPLVNIQRAHGGPSFLNSSPVEVRQHLGEWGEYHLCFLASSGQRLLKRERYCFRFTANPNSNASMAIPTKRCKREFPKN